MTDLQPAPQKRAYTPRQSNADRAAAKREAVLDSIPPEHDAELRFRAEKQAKAAQVEHLRSTIAAMDDMTPEAVRRSAHMALARLTAVAEPPSAQTVTVTIRKKGAGKISMGVHVPPYGEAHYEAGERVEMLIATARSYGPDGKDWVEFDDEEI